MSSVYLVLVIKDSQVVVSETYAGAQSALCRAFLIANQLNNVGSLINSFPSEERIPGGSIKWTFIKSQFINVMVLFQPIEVSISTKNDGFNIIHTVTAPTQPPPSLKSLYDLDLPLEESQPGGWFKNGMAATVDDLLNFPFDIKPFDQLTDNQTWALIKARISKRPNFTFISNEFRYSQHNAIEEIDKRSPIGKQINAQEIALLSTALDIQKE